MVENYKSLTQQELSDLQEKIVKEHWFPTSTHMSLHIYEERYNIDDVEYRLYHAICNGEVIGERELKYNNIYDEVIFNGDSWSATLNKDKLIEESARWNNIRDKYVCDCEKNYGKDCLYPDKYRTEGCK